jgi:diaminopimelate decarboxylase
VEHFSYAQGNLQAEDVSIATIAESIGTPFYCYSTATLVRHYRVFAQAFQDIPHQIHYALKANSNQAIIKTLAKEGAGADVVSEGEIRRALAAGIPASKIVFSGMGKTVQEIAYALDQDILQFNVESEPELETLSHIAQRKGKIAEIAIRVTPDVDGKTHAKITTGTKVSKFGIDIAQAPALYQKAASLEGIKIRSVSCHIGSQITELEPFQKAFSRVVDLVKELRADGHTIDRLDLGGGLGIPYDGDVAPPTPAEYAAIVKDVTRNLGCTLMFEPGRLIVGNAGILVSRVIALKKTPAREFLVVDAGMNDLVRPTLNR